MRRNRFPIVWTLAALALAIVASVVSSADAGLVAVSVYTGSNNKNNYGGDMSDLISGEELAKTDPDDPSTWTAIAPDHYSHEWQTASLLSGATNGKIAWTVLDFGSTVANLENAYFWNIREGTGQNRRTVDYNIHYATSPTVALPAALTNNTSIDYDFASGGWTLLNATPLTMPQRGAAPDPANQVVALGGVSARYVGVEILTNAGDTRAGLSEIAITDGPAAPGPVICEPFDYDVGDLHGQNGGTGFTGPWVMTKRNHKVTAANNTWGTLVTSGNRVNSNAWSALTRPIGSTLSDAGLMDNGATLWFSYVMDINGQNLTNLDFNFALCTDQFEAGDYSNRTTLVGGEGIGVGNYRPDIKGKYWQNNDADPIAEGVSGDTTLTLNATDNSPP